MKLPSAARYARPADLSMNLPVALAPGGYRLVLRPPRSPMPGRSRYEMELRRRIRDVELWPSFASPDLLERLDAAADRAFNRRTLDGNLAAVLIYHQLAEEMLRLLLRDCEFFVQLAVFPERIVFPVRRKQMFGQLSQALSEAMEFPRKERLLQCAGQLNAVRIEIVHGLIRRRSLRGLRRLATRAKRLNTKCFEVFDDAHDHFRLCFKDFRKDVFEEA